MNPRSREPELRVVDESGNAEYRWLRRSLSDRTWLSVSAGAFLGYSAYGYFDQEEGNPGAGIFVSFVPIIIDMALGGAYKFPSRLDFNPISVVRREPRAQQLVRPVQSGRGVLQRDVQPPRGLDVRAVLHIPQLHDLLERRREVVDGLQQQAP